MAPQKDYYNVLGVAASATPDQIKRAYSEARQGEPSRRERRRQGGDGALQGDLRGLLGAERRREAEAVRSAPQVRSLQRIFAAAAGGRAPAGLAEPASGSRSSTSAISAGWAGSAISSPRSSAVRRSAGGGPERGDSVETVVTIPFRVAALGGKVRSPCRWSRRADPAAARAPHRGSSLSTCAECRGTGTISFGYGGFAVKRPCPACRGRGKVAAQRCPTCQGVGEVRLEKRLMINVPPGTTPARRSGSGTRDLRRAPAGRRRATWSSPSRWSRTASSSATGSTSTARWRSTSRRRCSARSSRCARWTGNTWCCAFRRGRSPAGSFRIKGQGIEKGGARGDQIVDIQVEVPAKLSPEQEAVVKSWADSAGLKDLILFGRVQCVC